MKGRGPAGFLVHVSKSNLNNIERALINLRLQLGLKYEATSVQVTRVLVVIVQMIMKNLWKTKLPHLTKGLIGYYHYGLNIEYVIIA